MDYKTATRMTYDKIAKTVGITYDDYFNFCVKEDADFFLSKLPKSARILDVGCGIGTHMKYFKKMGFSPLGLDISEEMVRQCQKYHLDVIRADFEEINFRNKKFDGIWAHTSLIHFPKRRWRKLLMKISNLLTTDGNLFVAVREGTTEGYEIYKDDNELKRWFSNFRLGEIEGYLPNSLVVERELRSEFRDRVFVNVHIKKLR